MPRIIFAIIIIFNTGGMAMPLDPPEKTVYDKLNTALQWFFSYGIPQYYNHIPSDEIAKDLYKSTGTILTGPTITEIDRLGLYFCLHDAGKSMQSNRHLTANFFVKRFIIDIKEDVIEYWVVYISDMDSENDKCNFIITTAASITSPRSIIIREEQYIKTIEVAGRNISFPEDNLDIVCWLDAPRWSMSFRNSNLKDYQVEYKKDGSAYLRKISERERKQINKKYKIKANLP